MAYIPAPCVCGAGYTGPQVYGRRRDSLARLSDAAEKWKSGHWAGADAGSGRPRLREFGDLIPNADGDTDTDANANEYAGRVANTDVYQHSWGTDEHPYEYGDGHSATEHGNADGHDAANRNADVDADAVQPGNGDAYLLYLRSNKYAAPDLHSESDVHSTGACNRNTRANKILDAGTDRAAFPNAVGSMKMGKRRETNLDSNLASMLRTVQGSLKILSLFGVSNEHKIRSK